MESSTNHARAAALLLISIVGLLPAAACAPSADAPPPPDPGPGDYADLWGAGQSFTTFLASAEARVATWHENAERARVAPPLLERAHTAAEQIEGARLLVVAEDWCGDSAHTLPYVARLAGSVVALNLRIVDSEAGRGVMDAHPTPDGRSATPTMLLLDADFAERGCFVERPPELQRWFLENPDGLSRPHLLDEKYARYEADGGRATMEEIVAVLEAAARGQVRCPGPARATG